MSDAELIKEYVENGSEAAFRSLVDAHLALVYGAALRRLGNASQAEEVTQRVFILFARKAAWLRHRHDLSGWLYKTALLKAGELIRSEARRQERESQAAFLGAAMNEDNSILKSMAGVLDEALMDLHNKDRQVLLLRYIQNKSLRGVGEELGIKEDAAQKRVAKALELLVCAFRKRGFAQAGAASILLVLEAAGESAPAGLAAAVSLAVAKQAGWSALTGFGWVLTHLMNLAKIKQCAILLAVGVTPVAFQWHAIGQAGVNNEKMSHRLEVAKSNFRELDSNRESLSKDYRAMRARTDRLQMELNRFKAQAASSEEDARVYRWKEASEYVRVPKAILNKVILAEENDASLAGDERLRVKPHPILTLDGTVSPLLIKTLNLTTDKSMALKQCISSAINDFQKLSEQHTYATNSLPFYAAGAETKTLVTEPFPQEGAAIETRLRSELNAILGPDLAGVFWMQAQKDITYHFNDFGRARRETRMAYDTRFNGNRFYISSRIEEQPDAGEAGRPDAETLELPDKETLLEAGGFESWMEANYGVKAPRVWEARQASQLPPASLPKQMQSWWPEVFSKTNANQGSQP